MPKIGSLSGRRHAQQMISTLARKPPPSSPTSHEPKHETPRHHCATPLLPPSSPDGQLSSHTRHFQHLQPASSSRTQPTITISMASPHPSATSSHNSPQTQQTPAASPLIILDLLMDFAFGLCTSGDWPV